MGPWMRSGSDLTRRHACLGLAAGLLVGLIASACTPTSPPAAAPTSAQGTTVAPPVGRVLDPAVVPYADRSKAKAGTVMWTFALAFPKTGGPYFMKTEAGVDILWELT